MSKRIPLVTVIVLASGLAFGETSFDSYDTNNDDQLTKDEFYGLTSDVGIYSDWDTNGDGVVDETEFNEIGIDADFDTWDANGDGTLGEDEVYDGTFEYYDENEDGHWDGNEWDDAGDAGWLDV